MNNQFLYIPTDDNLYQPPIEGQTDVVKDPTEIAAESYPLSVRNHRNVYEIPIDKSKVYLNFNAVKIFITDDLLMKIDDNSFTFFVDAELPEPIKYFLPEGMLYRCLGEPLNDLRGYTYFVKENGIVKQIPDYKTVEVELAKRGISYTTVQVITEQECSDILSEQGGAVTIAPSQAAAWSDALGNSTGYNTLSNLSSNLATLAGITAQLGASTAQEQTNINNNLAAQAAAQGASQAAAASSAAGAGAGQAASSAAASSAAAAAGAANASAAEAEAAAAAATATAAAATTTTTAAAVALANAQNGII